MKKRSKLLPWAIGASLAWSIGFIYNVYYGGELSWLRMMYRDKIALAEKVQSSRRLLVTGGSGAHYTINSKLIERELGFPVLNLGIDGPVGLDVILPSILDRVRPGDIVLLVPEYLILIDDDGLGDRSANFGIAIGKPGLGGIPPQILARDLFLLGIPSLRSLTKSGLDLVEKGKLTGYYSDPVDDRGDPTTVKKRQGAWWKLKIDRPISQHALKRIARFRQEVEAKGGTLVLSLPWVYASTDPKTADNIAKTARELATIAPTIYNKNNLNIQTDSSLFADTHYHLLPQSRIIRSKQIVEELNPIINKLN